MNLWLTNVQKSVILEHFYRQGFHSTVLVIIVSEHQNFYSGPDFVSLYLTLSRTYKFANDQK